MVAGSSPPSLLDWNEDDVADFLRSSGCPDLSASLREHGISGEVLVMMESDDLRDVGVTSLGLRLGVLKAVEALKVEQGLSSSHDDGNEYDTSYSSSLADGDTSLASWRLTAGTSPPSMRSTRAHEAQLSRDLESVMDLIAEQTERINYLEEVIMSLTGGSITFPPPITGGTPKATTSSSQSLSLETPLYDHPSATAGGGGPRPGWLKKQPSFRWASYGRKASKGLSPTLASSAELDTSGRAMHDGDASFGAQEQQPGPPASSPLGGQMRLPPSALGSSEAVSPKTPTNAATLPIPHPATATSVISGRTGVPVSPSMATEVGPQASSSRAPPSATSHPAGAPSSSRPTPAADSSPLLPTSTALPPTAPLNTTSARASTAPSEVTRAGSVLGSAQNPQKFKVTLDDPCWKVLPAALKKYKIQDDWRMYALFICYGSTGPGTGTERCLSYDEKPLLLFQKLKETDQSPVFMLRHIRDIKSPIMLAQTKQAARMQAQQQSSSPSTFAAADVLAGPSTSGSGPSTSANPHPSARQSMLPAKSGSSGPTASTSSLATAAPDFDLGESHASLEERMTYAVAIYPYDPEREDEFLVGVDDTFLVLSKAKGWWIVQRDPSGSGTTAPDSALAGWVPAGCLLELSRPPAASGGVFGALAAQHGGVSSGRGRLRLTDIVSTSYPGVALMSYTRSGGDEMNLDKDDALWVFKRYSHWSYAIKESTGERGWVPSWFIGSQPPSAAAPAGGAGSTASDGVPQTPRVFGSPSGRIEPAVTTAAVDGDGGLRPGMF